MLETVSLQTYPQLWHISAIWGATTSKILVSPKGPQQQRQGNHQIPRPSCELLLKAVLNFASNELCNEAGTEELLKQPRTANIESVIHQQTHVFKCACVYVYVYIYIYIYVPSSRFASPPPMASLPILHPHASKVPTVTGIKPLRVAMPVTVVNNP